MRLVDLYMAKGVSRRRAVIGGTIILAGGVLTVGAAVLAAVMAWTEPNIGPIGSIALLITAALVADMVVNARVFGRLTKPVGIVLLALLAVVAILGLVLRSAVSVLLIVPVILSIPLLQSLNQQRRAWS